MIELEFKKNKDNEYVVDWGELEKQPSKKKIVTAKGEKWIIYGLLFWVAVMTILIVI